MPPVARLQIHGRVQGVFFRQSTLAEARTLGVCGFVRNLPDGTVEARVGGEKGAVEKLIAFCHHGPSGATVQKVDLVWLELDGEDYERDFSKSFEVR